MNIRPILLLVAATLVACGGYPEPKDAQIKSEAAVRGAQEVGATKSPQATLYLKYATDQIAEAKRLIADGDNERAEGVLMRAKADAELALVLAKLETEQKEATDAQAQVNDMKKKLGK